jgi:hypothetical protein
MSKVLGISYARFKRQRYYSKTRLMSVVSAVYFPYLQAVIIRESQRRLRFHVIDIRLDLFLEEEHSL